MKIRVFFDKETNRINGMNMKEEGFTEKLIFRDNMSWNRCHQNWTASNIETTHN